MAELSSENAMWNCPYFSKNTPITGEISAPGSKSYTNRYYVLKFLSENRNITLHNALKSRDASLMTDALNTIENAPENGDITINVGLAGTVMRFLPPIAALRQGKTTFTGDAGALKRPMGPILDGLEQLGVQIERQNGDYMPFTIIGTGQVRGGVIEIDASSSSQFVSGLLLTAAKFQNGITITHSGKTLPSLPHIEMTVYCLEQAGVTVTTQTDSISGSISWSVPHSPIQLPENVIIEPDLSNLMVFAASVLANPSGGAIYVKNWATDSIQPGRLFVDILRLMGADCTISDDNTLTITSNGTIKAIEYDLAPAGELTPTTAALCALSSGRSHLYGIKHLRGHETDRLEALVTEIRKIGRECRIDDAGDGIIIEALVPNKTLKPADFESYHDHRMATFAALIGLRVPGCRVNNIATTSKTMPDFADDWFKLLKLDNSNSTQNSPLN